MVARLNLFVVFLLMLAAGKAFAQPSNDNPCSSTALPVNASCTNATYTNAAATATTGVSAPACGNYNGADVWFSILVPASGTIQIQSTAGTITDGAMAVYTGTCNALTELACSDDFVGLMPQLTLSGLTGGTTIFLRYWSYGNTVQGTFQLCVVNLCPSGAPANDNPCSATVLTVTSTCTPATYSNNCATNSTGVSSPTCGNYQGGDVWFRMVVPVSGAVGIITQSAVITDGAMEAYAGTCSSLTYINCNDDNSFGSMPRLNLTGLTAGTSVFVRFWEYGNNNNGTFQLCVYDLCPGGGAPVNDQPCNAQPLQLNVYTQGSTTMCATTLNEPAPPACWINGSINTVWYSIVAPATSIRIRCNPVTMTDPQVALYGGVCGSALLALGCNNDGPPCGSFSPYADLTVTGLVTGATYYLAVDGANDDVGSFSLFAIDGSQPLPPIPGQDCGVFQPVCGQSFTVGNPGFTGVGNICDFNGAGICLAAGERASAWYEIPINGNGSLEFNIVPNDWQGAPSTTATDYDFAVWKTAGIGAVTCANIASGAVPLRCNFSALGVTGIYGNSAGNAPPAYPGFGAAYDSRINVSNGDKYVLVVSNYNVNTSGFNLNFSATSPIAYGAGPSATVYWSGSAGTDWFNIANWGGCTVPTCSTNAVVGSGIANQPLINGSNANVKTLTINPGATLSLRSPQIITVCENYVNNGALDAQAGSTVLFNNGGVAQQLSGNMVGNNALPHLQVNKTGGSVVLNQDAEIRGNLTMSNSTSVFNVSSRYVILGGYFNNSGSYTAVIPGTLEFNGTSAQAYTNTSAANLPNIRMNHKGPGLTLASHMNIGSFAKLTLDSGKIVTTTSFEVKVFNRAANAVTTGNTQSYVEGGLRRYINSTGSYDFPVSYSGKGLQRINVNFAYPAFPTTIDNIIAKFFPHAATPVALGASDCGVTFSNPGLNNGFWAVTANANPTVGRFDLTLYNLNYTNHTTSNAWTIMTSPTTSWSLANGTCTPTPVTAVQRLAMTGIQNFATAQSPDFPLPVEWLYFNARAMSTSVLLEWATASEDNNAGFEIYRSTNAFDFEKIGWKEGQGNSNDVNTYSFEDNTAKPGVNYYYRLHQVDFNGEYDESAIVTARLNAHTLSIVPNPVANDAIITYYTDNNNVKLDLLDYTGQVISTLVSGIREEGTQTYRFYPTNLGIAPGCYHLRLVAGDAVTHLPFCYIR